jgi:hypothetical protein
MQPIGSPLALPGDAWAPRLVLVTCANEYYADRRRQVVAAAQDPACNGIFSRVIEHDEHTITALPGYNETVAPMLAAYPRGWGYWAWKPLVVLAALQSLADDGSEALVYLDSGLSLRCNSVNREYAESLALISPSTGRDVTATYVGKAGDRNYLEYKWTKADLLAHLGALDNATVLNSQQFLGGFMFLRKTRASVALVQRWLDVFRTPHLVNDEGSVLPNKRGFSSHRHDQSAWSVLRKMHEGTAVIGDIGRLTTVARLPHPKALVSAERRRKKSKGKHTLLRG